MLEIGSAKRLRGLDWKQLGVGGRVRVEVDVLLLLFFYTNCVSGMQMGPEWRSDAELQLLRRWLQLPKRQIWIKSHWEILPCLLCKLRRHAGTAAISRRMTTVLFSSGLLRLVVFSGSAYPTGGWVRGRGEREGERNLFFSSPFICGWIFLYARLLKSLFPLFSGPSKAAWC